MRLAEREMHTGRHTHTHQVRAHGIARAGTYRGSVGAEVVAQGRSLANRADLVATAPHAAVEGATFEEINRVAQLGGRIRLGLCVANVVHEQCAHDRIGGFLWDLDSR